MAMNAYEADKMAYQLKCLVECQVHHPHFCTSTMQCLQQEKLQISSILRRLDVIVHDTV
jgi:hypothetical protein